MKSRNVVRYEDFGAQGDGVADDLPAICAAHTYANNQGLPVASQPDAIYHLGRRALTAVIATDTDWNTSRFTIEDGDVEDHTKALFQVCSLLPSAEFQISTLKQDQKHLDVHPDQDCYVYVENRNEMKFIRRGLNQNNGEAQQDCFILKPDGSVDSPIDWDYDEITHMEAFPIDETPLRLSGGIFTTYANRMRQETGYNYWGRNIEICRSNTEVDGLTHYVAGETAVGQPYRGFLDVKMCAHITIRNCFVTGHKMYKTIGAADKPVPMGSYDIHANRVVNFKVLYCRMNHILARSHWGVIATNFCKTILLEGCIFSRMDTHMGVSGGYTVRGCTLGHMGLNAIGRGKLLLEDSTLFGSSLINFREDYGSTWQGEVEIRNCHWIPACGEPEAPYCFGMRNAGMHDFGYPCSMPGKITIDGLTVEDTNHPEDYEGMTFFMDPDRDAQEMLPDYRPYAYTKCRELKVKGLVVMSGKPTRISPNHDLQQSVTLSYV